MHVPGRVREFKAKEASRRREVKNFKLRMQETSRRLQKAHVRVKEVLSSLKAEKIKGEARLLRVINSAKKVGTPAHVRGHWAGKLNKYRHQRAKLYRKLIQKNANLAKEVKTRRNRFAKARRVLAKEAEEVKRMHVPGRVKERLKKIFC